MTAPDRWHDRWQGAVFILIVEEGLVFIKRSLNVPTHKGQISFPGGKRDFKLSENDPIITASRELNEELSVDLKSVLILGLLPPVYTANNFMVIPVLGRFEGSLTFFASQIRENFEWDEAFWVSFAKLFEQSRWFHGLRMGKESNGSIIYRSFLSSEMTYLFQIPHQGLRSPSILWGATARMVWNLNRMLIDSADEN